MFLLCPWTNPVYRCWQTRYESSLIATGDEARNFNSQGEYILKPQLQAIRLRLQFFRLLTEDVIQAEAKRLAPLGERAWLRMSWFLSLTPHEIKSEIVRLIQLEQRLTQRN